MIYKSIIFALAIFTFSHPESLFSQEIEDGVPILPQTSTGYNCIQFTSGYYKVCDLIQAKVQKSIRLFRSVFLQLLAIATNKLARKL